MTDLMKRWSEPLSYLQEEKQEINKEIRSLMLGVFSWRHSQSNLNHLCGTEI